MRTPGDEVHLRGHRSMLFEPVTQRDHGGIRSILAHRRCRYGLDFFRRQTELEQDRRPALGIGSILGQRGARLDGAAGDIELLVGAAPEFRDGLLST